MGAAADELKQLTDQHFRGELDTDSYIWKRGALLDDLVGMAPREPAPEPPEPTIRVSRRSQNEAAAAIPAAPPAPQVTPPPASTEPAAAVPVDDKPTLVPGLNIATPLLVLIGVGAVGILVTAMVLFSGSDDETVPPPAPDVVESSPSLPRGTQLLQDLLEQKNWSDSQISAFLFEWDQLTVDEVDEARSSEQLRRLAADVRSRIQLERSLGTAGSQDGLSLAESVAGALELELGLDRRPVDRPAEELVAGAAEAVAAVEAVDEDVVATVAADTPVSVPPEAETVATAEVVTEAATPVPATDTATGQVESERAEPDTTETPPPATVSIPEPEPEPEAEAAPVEAEAVVAAPTPAASDDEPAAVATTAPEPADPEPSAATQAPAVVAAPAASPAVAQTEQELPRGALGSKQRCGAERLGVRSRACWDMLAEGEQGPRLLVVPGGEFVMGDAEIEGAGPVSTETIEAPFAIGLSEVSVGEFERFCSTSELVPCPERRWNGDTFPAVDVSWQHAVAYTNWLSEVTGASYRLPTEAEWEYAARAGEAGPYPFGDKLRPTDARFDSGGRSLAPLPLDDRTTRSNGFGLRFVVGNVREWTADPWRPTYDAEPEPGRRAIRGGSYVDPAEALRSAARTSETVEYSDGKTGFRLVRDLQ